MSDEMPTGAPPVSENTAPAPETGQTEINLDSDLNKIWDAHEKGLSGDDRPRDEHGRFAKAAGEGDESQPGDPPLAEREQQDEGDPAKEDSGDQSPKTEVEGEPAQAQAIAPPMSWSKEAREHWAKIPVEAQQVIAQREVEAHRYISQLGEQVKSAEPLLGVLKQNADVFQRRGVSFEQGVAALIEAQRSLERDPISAIQYFARSAGVDLSMFANADGYSGQSPEVAALQNQLSAAMRQIDELSGTVHAREQNEQAAQLQQAERELLAFQSEHSIDESTLDAIVELAAMYGQTMPAATIRQRLDKALEDWTWTDPQRRQAAIEKEFAVKREAEEKALREKAEKAAKAKAVNVKSSPVATHVNVDVDAELERIWNARHN